MPSNYKTVINFRDGIQVDTDDLISNNGLVGIGSTIPRQQLDVRGNVIVSEGAEFNNVTVTGISSFKNDIAVSSGSSVGIGTTVPEAAFQVGIGTTGFTVDEQGNVTAVEYFGSGANLTNIPASVWTNPGAGDTIFTLKDVGIGTDQPRGGADFAVGYEIYMDAESGIGTFEGLVTKNITVLNETGAGQGNINAEVGTFSTITASSAFVGSLAGNADSATVATNAQGLTDVPAIVVSSVVSGGGTFSNLTEFESIQVSGGITASNGIVTATTFSGTATTSLNASVAYAIAGQPDIEADKIDSLGINSIFIRNTGVSTFGGEVSVGNFLGVGATSSSLGKGMGVIGAADFSGSGTFGGDLAVEGNLSIGGTFGGAVNVTDVTAGEIIATGILSATTSSSVVLHDTTITGNVVQSAGKNLTVGQNLSIGGTTTFGSQINFGDASTQVAAAGTLFANLSGIITTGGITVGDLDVSGTFSYTGGSIATFGSILLNSNTGFVSCSSIEAGTGIISCTGLNARTGEITGGGLNLTGPTTSNNFFQSTSGVSTFFDLDITGGTNSNLQLTRLGFNTSLGALGITEGIALWDDAEIYVNDSPASGIGIGTTSGKRDSNVALYVGYGRDGSGNFINGQSVFEGGVGIGTMMGNDDGNMLEVYKETVFHSYHTGVGGTDAGPARVGFETNKPRTTLDLGFVTSGFLRIPSYFNDDPNNTVPTGGTSAGTGSLFFDTASNTVAVKNSQDNWVGLSTVLNTGDDPAQYVQELGFIGGVTTQAERLSAEQGVANIIQPYDEVGAQGIGWGTAHMWYNKTFNKHQYKTNQGIGVATHYRSYVSTGTSAIDIELDSSGTKVYITLPGIGSATLNLV